MRRRGEVDLAPVFRTLAIAAAVGGVLAGCVGMHGANCAGADWRGLGYRDGSNGLGLAFLERRRDACAAFGVAADEEAYLRGREEGIAAYCAPEHAFELGRFGEIVSEQVCPPPMRAAFSTAYYKAWIEYRHERSFGGRSKSRTN